MSSSDEWDAIVIGSGATGGIAARELTAQGLRTLILEAGPPMRGGHATYGNQATNLARHLSQLWVTRHQPVQQWHAGYWETHPRLFVNDRENPYTHPEDKPYFWIRGRQVGGRSHSWGGVCLRFSEHEFESSQRDGKGPAWPIGYDDVAPWYSRIEQTLAVHGARDGLTTLPDGEYLAPGQLSPGELHLKQKLADGLDRTLVVSRGIRAGRRALPGEAHSRLSSNQTSLAAALGTGLATVRSDSVVCRIVVDLKTGRASGVEFIDRTTRALHRVDARLVVLCASTIETIRLLLLSKLGADSGQLGVGVMDHLAANVYFHLPEVAERDDFELLGSESVLVPRYANLGSAASERSGFTRGYGFWGGVHRLKFPPMLRKTPRQALGFLTAMGEALHSDRNRVSLDATTKDEWGIAAAHIDCAWQPEDLALARTMVDDARTMVKAAGGVEVSLTDAVHTPLVQGVMTEMNEKWTLTPPGLMVHEVGGARMGATAKDSVTNAYGQLWDCPNVIVGDGAVMASSGWQNSTLTLMALAARACDHAVGLLRRGDL